MDTVYFLGAGASKAVGYPLTRELFQIILDRLGARNLYERRAEHPKADEHMEEFERLLLEVFPTIFDKGVEVPLLTDVLTLIDSFIAAKVVPSKKTNIEKLSRLRWHFERGLLSVLDEPIDVQIARSARSALESFSSHLLRRAEHGDRISLLTTNYDISVEKLLCSQVQPSASESVDFGLSWRDPSADGPVFHHRPAAPKLRVYKLHGSINWLKCPLCGYLYIDVGGYNYYLAYQDQRCDENSCHCDFGPLDPLIVAPSLVRDVRDPNLITVWQSAIEALRTADEWVLVGYSLPSEDIGIRSILLRAYHGREKAPVIKVVQLNPDAELRGRYRFLLPNSEFEESGFVSYVEQNLK